MKKSEPVPSHEAVELLRWYDGVQRDLPWRLNRDPYRIWVSEVMLQQTQVNTVIPYYERFMQRFPNVEDLAAAEIDDVLSFWSGLGYYRRARQLHTAAREVVDRGGFPTTAEGLLALSGIGPYTAAAVASMAFQEVVPVLDGNVERVLCRWLAWEEDAKRAPIRRRLLEEAVHLLDSIRPGDSNQAMMELGALVCRPKNPRCAECPLASSCLGRHQGPERYPLPRRRRATERVDLAVVVVQRQERLLLFRRAGDSTLMAGLWELPTVPMAKNAGRDTAAIGAELAQIYGGSWSLRPLERMVRHSVTHRAMRLHLFEGTFTAGGSVAEGPEAVWADGSKRQELGLSSMVGKVLKAFEVGKAQGTLSLGSPLEAMDQD